MTPAAAGAAPPRERVWDAGRPVDLAATLGPLVRGRGDPAHRVDPSGFWWACATPAGAATTHLAAARGVVTARSWGAGADWVLDRLPVLVGAGDGDAWSALDLRSHPVLAGVLRARPGLRLPSTGLVLDSLVPAIIEQKVTGVEARRAWRSLLWRHGTPAPGPREDLRVPPGPAALLAVPTWDWHRYGVDISRQRAVRAVATVAARLEECVTMAPDAAAARLRSLPGVGVWTVAETLQRAAGHPDLVSVGDYHVHDLVVHCLTGRARGSDKDMLRALEPWRGQRQRIVRLVELSGVRKPRFGARLAVQDHRAH